MDAVVRHPIERRSTMTLKALKKILDNNFRPPFLPEGMVKTA